MKKFKVIWYEGDVTKINIILSQYEVESQTIQEVDFLQILPKQERDKFAVDIKYAMRTIFLKEDKIHTIDYGSHSKFIWIEEI